MHHALHILDAPVQQQYYEIYYRYINPSYVLPKLHLLQDLNSLVFH